MPLHRFILSSFCFIYTLISNYWRRAFHIHIITFTVKHTTVISFLFFLLFCLWYDIPSKELNNRAKKNESKKIYERCMWECMLKLPDLVNFNAIFCVYAKQNRITFNFFFAFYILCLSLMRTLKEEIRKKK